MLLVSFCSPDRSDPFAQNRDRKGERAQKVKKCGWWWWFFPSGARTLIVWGSAKLNPAGCLPFWGWFGSGRCPCHPNANCGIRSRLLQIDVDEAKLTARIVWKWAPESIPRHFVSSLLSTQGWRSSLLQAEAKNVGSVPKQSLKPVTPRCGEASQKVWCESIV